MLLPHCFIFQELLSSFRDNSRSRQLGDVYMNIEEEISYNQLC